MRTMRIRAKPLGIPFWRTVEKPHIRRNRSTAMWAKRYAHFRAEFIYVCMGEGTVGVGLTAAEAWNDWANWALA